MKSKKIFKIIAAGILLAAMILLIFIRHYHRSTSVKRPKDAYVKKTRILHKLNKVRIMHGVNICI